VKTLILRSSESLFCAYMWLIAPQASIGTHHHQYVAMVLLFQHAWLHLEAQAGGLEISNIGRCQRSRDNPEPRALSWGPPDLAAHQTHVSLGDLAFLPNWIRVAGIA